MRAVRLGQIDGFASAILDDCKDYSDDFIRRASELTEDDRATYKAAWYESHAETLKAVRS